jgi:hypothetical protein
MVSFLLEKLLDWHVLEEGIWVFWGKVGLRGRDDSDFQLHSKRKITINFCCGPINRGFGGETFCQTSLGIYIYICQCANEEARKMKQYL